MTAPAVRQDVTRGEIVHAFVWLCLFAMISALLEVAYLRCPLTWAAAFGFNMVLTKTAKLWTRSLLAQCIPLASWVVGVVLAHWVIPGADMQLVPVSPATVALVVAGAVGGIHPLLVCPVGRR